MAAVIFRETIVQRMGQEAAALDSESNSNLAGVPTKTFCWLPAITHGATQAWAALGCISWPEKTV